MPRPTLIKIASAASGPATVLAIEKFIGNVTGPINLPATYTNQYAIAANTLEGYTS